MRARPYDSSPPLVDDAFCPRPEKPDGRHATRGGRRHCNDAARYGFVIVRPVTMDSVLCDDRMPYTPSVDLSRPTVTRSARHWTDDAIDTDLGLYSR